LQFDPEDAFSVLFYASGALVAFWLVVAVVGAIDSIPLVRMFIYLIILKLLGTMNNLVWISSIFMASVSKIDGSCGSWLHHLVRHPISAFQGCNLNCFGIQNNCALQESTNQCLVPVLCRKIGMSWLLKLQSLSSRSLALMMIDMNRRGMVECGHS